MSCCALSRCCAPRHRHRATSGLSQWPSRGFASEGRSGARSAAKGFYRAADAGRRVWTEVSRRGGASQRGAGGLGMGYRHAMREGAHAETRRL